MMRRLSAVVVVSVVAVLGAVGDADAQAYGPRPGALRVSVSVAAPGVSISIGGDGFDAKAVVRIALDSEQGTLATVEADSAGRLAAAVRIPPATAPGTHTLTARGRARDGGTLVLSSPVLVRAAGQTGGDEGRRRVDLPGTTGNDNAQATGADTARRAGGSLARTGASTGILVLVAVVLVLMGVVAAKTARRRRFGNR